MKILHYSLGFPPYRSGGMTTFCINLIEEQCKQGHIVSMMWPGVYSLKNKKTILKETNYTLNDVHIRSYELQNGLPVSLLDGIRDTKQFQKPIEKELFLSFFMNHKFDILHVHTLMGLPIECIEAANENGIKTVFTTHDCFGICCKQGLFVNGHICDDHKCLHCYDCNDTALSLSKISLLQSSLYRRLKDSSLLRFLRKRHNNRVFSLGDKKELRDDREHARDYLELRNYYVDLLSSFQLIHYNSSLIKKVYESFGVRTTSAVFLVSHKGIKPNYILNDKVNYPINIGYFGPINVHKGFFFLKNVLDEVYRNNKNFKLHVFNKFNNNIPYFINHGPYRYEDLHDIMKNIDLVVVPSQYYETFGFNTLEALSFGKPVIVTENVGAKDLVLNGKNGFILKEKEQWISTIITLIENPFAVNQMNKFIVEKEKIMDFRQYVISLTKKLYEGSC